MEIPIIYKPEPTLNFTMPEAVAKKYLEAVFRQVLSDFKPLPEYDGVISWLCNNNGRGLALIGQNGRGKSIIARYLIPNVFRTVHSKFIHPVDAPDMNEKLEVLLRKKLLILDDIGTEEQRVVYGERRWAFPEIMDKAEKNNNIVVFTSNLGAASIEQRYGIRTRERIRAMCKTVVFEGESLRK